MTKGKNDKFIVPGELYIHRFTAREGPSPYFIVWQKDSARVFTDPKVILKHIKWPVKTPTGDAIREWFKTFEEVPVPKEELDMKKIYKEGWGPEAHEEDPTANTKMVT